MSQLFSFSPEHTWVLSMEFLYLLDTLSTYLGFLRNFFFFSRVFSVLYSSFMSFYPLELFLFSVIEFRFLRRWSENPTPFLSEVGWSIHCSSFVNCPCQLCSLGQGANCVTSYKMWPPKMKRMGRCVGWKKHNVICGSMIMPMVAIAYFGWLIDILVVNLFHQFYWYECWFLFFFKFYFIVYAVTAPQLFPLCVPPPSSPSLIQVIPTSLSMSMGHAYMFFGYSLSCTVLCIPMAIL